ncbi:glycosyltransferase family 2 protein [Vreelandella sedimenti]|uniref:glycosyltransferase family 2 protein n=1 Tax=Vreelandella sedimenti TaxID=2729618 RepID=UPI00257A5553|nr:glycosyltransferase [Halomonas sp. UBA3173]|tara:strand:+ start:17932 stop:18885 length:954 start_codon:yes stop_codon:yes gene_type:complete
MPQISVIVPAFKPHDFISLHESMAANAGVDAEWIVVDDGSGSNFDAVFSTLPEGVRLLRQKENCRQGAARNAGLAVARGRWVKFLDADDKLDEGHLAALLAAAGQGRAIPFAATKHVFIGGGVLVNESWCDLPPDPDVQFRRLIVRPFLHHCGALFPRHLLTSLNGYDESLVTDEDGDLLLRILRSGYHFIPVEGVHYLYIHHQAESRVSADNDIKKMQARIRVCEKVVNGFAEQLPVEVAEALAQRMDKVAMNYWTAFPSEAQALLAQARRLAPGYRPDMRLPLRLMRDLGRPGMVLAAQGLYRRLKGRPKGGAQG